MSGEMGRILKIPGDVIEALRLPPNEAVACFLQAKHVPLQGLNVYEIYWQALKAVAEE